MTAAAPAASSCCVRWEPMRLAPPVTTNRPPAMCMPVLRRVPSRPLPPLVGEDEGLRICFAVEHPPPVLPAMGLEYAGGDGHHASRHRGDQGRCLVAPLVALALVAFAVSLLATERPLFTFSPSRPWHGATARSREPQVTVLSHADGGEVFVEVQESQQTFPACHPLQRFGFLLLYVFCEREHLDDLCFRSHDDAVIIAEDEIARHDLTPPHETGTCVAPMCAVLPERGKMARQYTGNCIARMVATSRTAPSTTMPARPLRLASVENNSPASAVRPCWPSITNTSPGAASCSALMTVRKSLQHATVKARPTSFIPRPKGRIAGSRQRNVFLASQRQLVSSRVRRSRISSIFMGFSRIELAVETA